MINQINKFYQQSAEGYIQAAPTLWLVEETYMTMFH